MRNEHEPFGSSKSKCITLLLHPTKHAKSESIVAASLVSETHLPNVTEGPKSARTRAFDLFNKAEVLTRFTLPPRTCSLLTQRIYDEAKGDSAQRAADCPSEVTKSVVLCISGLFADCTLIDGQKRPLSGLIEAFCQGRMNREDRLKSVKELVEEHFKKVAEIRDEFAKQTEGMRTVGFFDQYPRLKKQPHRIIKLLDEYLEEGKKWRLRQ